MNKTRRKPLEPWQAEDAARLKALFEQASKDTQEDFGSKFDIGSQSLVWQYLNAWIPLNLRVALRFARGLGCRVRDISPTLAADLPDDPPHQGDLFAELLQKLPADDAQQLLDFIEYKVQRAEKLLTNEHRASYHKWAERVTQSLEELRRKPPESAD